jgi:hypothetical protein
MAIAVGVCALTVMTGCAPDPDKFRRYSMPMVEYHDEYYRPLKEGELEKFQWTRDEFKNHLKAIDAVSQDLIAETKPEARAVQKAARRSLERELIEMRITKLKAFIVQAKADKKELEEMKGSTYRLEAIWSHVYYAEQGLSAQQRLLAMYIE